MNNLKAMLELSLVREGATKALEELKMFKVYRQDGTVSAGYATLRALRDSYEKL